MTHHVALAQPVARDLPEREGPLTRIGRILPAVQRRQLAGQPVVQPGRHRGIRPAGEPERPLELRRGLAVRAQADRPRRGGGRVAQRGRAVPGRLGVEGQPGVVVAAEAAEGLEDPGLYLDAAVRGDGVLHGEPGDLVAELRRRAVPGEQPGGEQVIDGRRRGAGDRLQQAELDAGADQRGRVQHVAGAGVQPGHPGQDHVPGRGRDLTHPGLHHFGHVERVPAGQPVQRGRFQPAAGGQHRRRARGQRGEADPPDRPLGGQVPQGNAERIVRGQPFIPVGRDEQHGGVPDPPAQKPQQVDGGLIGPVDILHDQHVQLIRLADLAQQGTEEVLARRVRPAEVEELTAQLGRDIKQGPERPRGEQAVAGPPEPGRLRQVPLHLLDQRRLAHARLAGHEHQPALGLPGLPRIAGQRGQLRLPFQQHPRHPPTGPATPSRAACLAAAFRSGTPSLASTADT